MQAIDEWILISGIMKNQHYNEGRGKSGNFPNSFDQDCSFYHCYSWSSLLPSFFIEYPCVVNKVIINDNNNNIIIIIIKIHLHVHNAHLSGLEINENYPVAILRQDMKI